MKEEDITMTIMIQVEVKSTIEKEVQVDTVTEDMMVMIEGMIDTGVTMIRDLIENKKMRVLQIVDTV